MIDSLRARAKARIVRALGAAYPQSWRNEYGDELGGVLCEQRLTARMVADTTLRGIQERFRRDPWFSCGLALSAWTLFGIVRNNTNPLIDSAYLRYVALWMILVFLAACLTAARGPRRKPFRSAMKAATMGLLPELAAMALWGLGLYEPRLFSIPNASLVVRRLALFMSSMPSPPQMGVTAILFFLAIMAQLAVPPAICGALIGWGARRVGEFRRAR